MDEVFAVAYEHGFTEVSVYCLSKDNLGRSEHELAAVFNAFSGLGEAIANYETKTIVEVNVIGCLEQLPLGVQEVLRSVVRTAEQPLMRVNLLICYDAWEEIERSMLSGQALRLSSLWVTSRVDAVIRTAGATLLSGFLPLQAQYAQLFVVEELFNELSSPDLRDLISRASKVYHRFGK